MRGSDEFTDEEMAQIEAETRALLARWGEPQMAPPPPDLSARVVRQLFGVTPTPTYRRPWWQLWPVLPLVLLAIGAWGLWIDSTGPALLVGGLETDTGRLLVTLTLIAKPIWNLWFTTAWWLIPSLFLLIGGGWLWRTLIIDAPLAEVE
ncbi:MAG: hypothetical protein C0184_12130 [Chloroflexus aggregans]|uniref:Uncharacterized protein n=1 Tax=Chloroflexus aggregans TaxID=152260 RepID=A0A2J6X0J3_9CHLR|nr:MAG: hypothetical protein C0184_12130 [Chloroflexus aggregans]